MNQRKKVTVESRLVFIKPLLNTISLNVLPASIVAKFKRSPRKLFFIGVSDIFNVMYIITRMVSVLNINEGEIKAYIETVINAVIQEIIRISYPALSYSLTPFDIEFLADLQLDYKSLK